MLTWIFGAAGVIVLIGTGIIIRDMNRFVVVHHDLHSDKIAKEMKFVLLTDLHNKSYGKNNSRLLEAIEQQRPDGVLIAGDMLTALPGNTYEEAVSLVGALQRRYPVYYANGNHERRLRLNTKTFGSTYQDYMEELKHHGVEPLINAHVMLHSANIDICGLELEQTYFHHFTKREMADTHLEELVGKPKKDSLQILLAHNPDYFPEYAAWGADLVLSGHVHGGIVRLPVLGGVLSPAMSLFPKYDGGIFREGNATMILSRGLGTHTLPVRMWNPGELIVLSLHRK